MYIKRRQRVELPADKTGKFAASVKSAEAELAKFQKAWKDPVDDGGIDTYAPRSPILGLKSVKDAVAAGKAVNSFTVPRSYSRETENGGVDYHTFNQSFKWDGKDFVGPTAPGQIKTPRGETARKSNKMLNSVYASFYGGDHPLMDPDNIVGPSTAVAAPGFGRTRQADRDDTDYISNDAQQLSTLNTWNTIVGNVAKAKENLAAGKETRSKEINIFNRNLNTAARDKNRIQATAKRRRTGTKGHQIDLLGGLSSRGGINI